MFQSSGRELVVQHLKKHAEYIVVGRAKWFGELCGE